MAKSKKILTSKHWKNLDLLRRFDPTLTDFLLKAVPKAGARVQSLSPIVEENLFAFDKYFWRPNRFEFLVSSSPPSLGSKILPAAVLLHECVHQMFFDSYESQSFHDPTFSLLAEATASSLDIYYWILTAAHLEGSSDQFFQQVGVANPTLKEKRLIERQIGQIAKKGGGAKIIHFYQEAFFNLYKELDEVFQQNFDDRKLNAKKLEQLFKSREGTWVAKKFDLMINITFSRAYATTPFSAQKYGSLLKAASKEKSIVEALKALL